jgi:hypothetical protein
MEELRSFLPPSPPSSRLAICEPVIYLLSDEGEIYTVKSDRRSHFLTPNKVQRLYSLGLYNTPLMAITDEGELYAQTFTYPFCGWHQGSVSQLVHIPLGIRVSDLQVGERHTLFLTPESHVYVMFTGRYGHTTWEEGEQPPLLKLSVPPVIMIAMGVNDRIVLATEQGIFSNTLEKLVEFQLSPAVIPGRIKRLAFPGHRVNVITEDGELYTFNPSHGICEQVLIPDEKVNEISCIFGVSVILTGRGSIYLMEVGKVPRLITLDERVKEVRLSAFNVGVLTEGDEVKTLRLQPLLE